MPPKDFIACILTHGRPTTLVTLRSLRKHGYTGPVCIILDNEDATHDRYVELFGSDPKVVIRVFDKKKIADTFDEGDNSGDRRAIVYARNASFGVVKELGYKFFIQLDDDYTSFDYRIRGDGKYTAQGIKNLDGVFAAMLTFFKTTKVAAVAMAQGGDFIGGSKAHIGYTLAIRRKCMNTFVCAVDRPLTFIGRVNEDVNTYVTEGSRGALFVTLTHISITQRQTQGTSGGMTELYLDSGTYTKSFYTVMYAPSCVTVGKMGPTHGRMHHDINWRKAVPVLLSPSIKKKK